MSKLHYTFFDQVVIKGYSGVNYDLLIPEIFGLSQSLKRIDPHLNISKSIALWMDDMLIKINKGLCCQKYTTDDFVKL